MRIGTRGRMRRSIALLLSELFALHAIIAEGRMDKKKPITARMLAAATSSALPAVIRGLQRIGIDVPDPDTPLDIDDKLPPEPPPAPARPQVFLVHGHDQVRDK